jgi:hypothetical protein
MDELFYHSIRTVREILKDADEITRARIADQMKAMYDAYGELSSRLNEAERREERLRKRYEALKKSAAAH